MELVLDISKVVSDQIGYKRGKKKRRSIYNWSLGNYEI
jgi:hypothetical protein